MALVSLTNFPSPPAPCIIVTQVRVSPPSVALCHQTHQTQYHLRPLQCRKLAGVASRIRCCQRVRASAHSSNNPSHPSDEEGGPFQPEEGDSNGSDDSVNSPLDPLASSSSLNEEYSSIGPITSESSFPNGAGGHADSSSSSSSSSSALQSGVLTQQQNEQLQQTLATVSESLSLFSATLSEISSAVRLLFETLRSSQSQPSSMSSFPSSSPLSSSASSPMGSPPPNARDLEAEAEAARSRGPYSPGPPDFANAGAAAAAAASREPMEGEEIEKSIIRHEDKVPAHLVEQNKRAHELAYKLQQSFVQARIEGLGKPFQAAVDDFTTVCMAAYELGIGLNEFQLQLVLQDGSLRGAFAIRNQRWAIDPILNEESRIRSLWIRLVYTTLAQLEPDESVDGAVDPIDSFVKQVVQMALETGYDLERAKLEQTFTSSDVNSRAVKTMKENQYLILLTLEKAKSRNR